MTILDLQDWAQREDPGRNSAQDPRPCSWDPGQNSAQGPPSEPQGSQVGNADSRGREDSSNSSTAYSVLRTCFPTISDFGLAKELEHLLPRSPENTEESGQAGRTRQIFPRTGLRERKCGVTWRK